MSAAMNLLIVDDQIHVIHGLEKGIDWREAGFERVYTALNAIEARQIIRAYPIDVMLCDIEMPFENGLSLIRWLRQEHYSTRCILLTAHPDFNYARDAIPLDVTDYVVQPAPYREVLQAVQKAVQELRASSDRRKLARLGAELHENRDMLAAMALNTYLQSRQSAPYEKTRQMYQNVLPGLEEYVGLACIRIMRWNTSEQWENETLYYALNNIVQESFQTASQSVVLTELQPREYICVLWDPEGLQNAELLTRQFEFLRGVFENYFRCEIAVYLDLPVAVKKLPQALDHLRAMHEGNLGRRSTVQVYHPAQHSDYTYHGASQQFSGLRSLLEQGYPNAVLKQCQDFLEKEEQSGNLTPQVLRGFYQDFMQTLYQASPKTGVNPKKLFEDAQAFALYKSATLSLEDMRAFLTYVCSQYDRSSDPVNAEYMVEQAVEYIEKNLEKELHRDEIADYVHISASYLSRIFRKKMGVSLKAYIIDKKMKMAQSMLRTTSLPINLIAVKVGYTNFSQFSQVYKDAFGCTPSMERKKAEGTE